VSMKADGGFFAKVSAEKLCRCQEACPHFSRLQLAAADLFLLLPNIATDHILLVTLSNVRPSNYCCKPHLDLVVIKRQIIY